MTRRVLFNKGKSIVKGRDVVLDESGAVIMQDVKNELGEIVQAPLLAEYDFMPDTAIEFSEAEALKLKRLYPHKLLDIDDVKKQFSTATQAQKNAPAVKTPTINKDAEAPPAPVMKSDLTEEELEAVRKIRAANPTQPAAAPPPTLPGGPQKNGKGILDIIKG